MKDLIFSYVNFYLKVYKFYDWESPTTSKNYKIMDNNNGETLLMYDIQREKLVITDKLIDDVSNAIGPNESEILNSVQHWFENEYGFSPLISKL